MYRWSSKLHQKSLNFDTWKNGKRLDNTTSAKPYLLIRLSSQIRNLTHPPEPSDPALEPTDQSSVTGQRRVSTPWTRNDGSVGGFEAEKTILTDSTLSNQKIAHFLSDLLRSNLNSKENRPFSVRSVEIRPKLEESGDISSRFGLISSRFAEISSRSSHISPRSA